jgi:hypothetical protein
MKVRATLTKAAEVEEWVQYEIRRYVPDWPSERVEDRVRLRIAL